jgi:dUTPase
MRSFEIIKKYEHLNPIIPKRATSGSAGYDLSSNLQIKHKYVIFIKAMKISMYHVRVP